MKPPLVTIAIPIFNAGRYLHDAVQSCINQTYSNWELLLMCDGSTDDSTSIAYEMATMDSRIRVIDDGENKGLIYRLNQSVNLANGEFYARMDADDIMYITRIEEQSVFLENHPEIDVVGTSIMTIDDENNVIGSGLYEGIVTSFVHPSVMGRTIWFKKNPYAEWPLRAEDKELWVRTSATSKFYAIGKPLLFYREFGIPTFQKYYTSQKTLLKIYANYKEYSKSLFWSIKYRILTLGKILVTMFFVLLGKTELIVKLRKRPNLPKELWLTKDDLGYCIRFMNNNHFQ